MKSSLLIYDPNCSWHGCQSAETFVRKMLTEPPVAERRWYDPGPETHGVLVQLPIEDVTDPKGLFDLIPVRKDVDVFHPENVGLVLQGRPRYKTCTPNAVLQLLTAYDIGVEGKTVCIINSSDIVGKPLAAMLINAGATVTVCHHRTPSSVLKTISRSAEIVVVAVGVPGFLTSDMVATGAVVVDVGINRLSDGRVVGDVDFQAVSEKAAWISPVPGGVGPCTVACLLVNTLEAAWNAPVKNFTRSSEATRIGTSERS